ncbi:hypothetical protein GE21DRAFT_1088186 [Neurospora crassa]|nr:hypothetical protein GE21DRAFT_1088186 [Neurospora crassa]
MLGRRQRKELYDYIFWVLNTSWRCLFLFSFLSHHVWIITFCQGGNIRVASLNHYEDKTLAKDSGTLLLHRHVFILEEGRGEWSTKGEEQTATFILGEQAADMLVTWIDGLGYVTTQIRNWHLTFGVCVCVYLYLRAVIRDT